MVLLAGAGTSARDSHTAKSTYLRAAEVWRNVCRAADQHGQVTDVYVSNRRNTTVPRHFFEAALADRDCLRLAAAFVELAPVI